VAATQLTRVHKGSTGANGVQDKGLPVYTAVNGSLMVVLDTAQAVALGNPNTITVDITTP
jgi:hypothetical protein